MYCYYPNIRECSADAAVVYYKACSSSSSKSDDLEYFNVGIKTVWTAPCDPGPGGATRDNHLCTLCNVQVQCAGILHRYTVHVHLRRCTAQEHCAGALHRYTAQVHGAGLLRRCNILYKKLISSTRHYLHSSSSDNTSAPPQQSWKATSP